MNNCLDELRNYDSPKASIREFGLRLLSNPTKTGYLPPLRVFTTVFVKGKIDPVSSQNPIGNDFGEKYLAPIFKKGQEKKEFKDGNPEEFAGIYWNCLLGYMTHIIQKDDKYEDVSHLDSIIKLFEC